MQALKISAFSINQQGGNPAGVVIQDTLPAAHSMQSLAAELGYSETVFAAPAPQTDTWRVRYFSPENEVPFCGHATIALGVALAERLGTGTYPLILNDGQIEVSGRAEDGELSAALRSPGTRSETLSSKQISDALAVFGYSSQQIDPRIPPAHIFAGADHFVFALRDRASLAAMEYNLDAGRQFMLENGLVTVMFVVQESATRFFARNAFASGGVLEDPATGAAAAAFMGYLRDTDQTAATKIEIFQGQDMGQPSRIQVEATTTVSAPVTVSGAAHHLDYTIAP